jgi:hypothetical protein
MIHIAKVLPWAIMLTSCAAPHPRGEGEWSLPAGGLQARFQFEAGECVEGVTLVRTFVELRNVSDQGGPLYLLFSQGDCLRSELLDAAGRSIEMSGGLGNLKISPPATSASPANPRSVWT